jgi:cell division FtsZ-interacting protein ZapD
LELQRQKEIIERWLDTPGIPADARQKLVEMLAEVNGGISDVVVSGQSLDGVRIAS